MGYGRLTIGERDKLPPLDVPQIEQAVTVDVPCVVALGEGWEISAERIPLTNLSTILSNTNPSIAYIPATTQITLRSRKAGERVRLLGAPGSTKLKRVMIDRKIPERVRQSWPLVEVNGEIVWVVGQVMMEAGRVLESHKTCMQLTLRRHKHTP